MFRGSRCLALLGLVVGALAITAGSASAAAWLAPADLTLAPSDLGFDGQGNAIAVGIGEDSGGDPAIQATTLPLGGQWSAPVTISGSGEANFWEPRVAVDPAGGAVAIWASSPDGSATHRTVWIADRSPGGTWSVPVFLSGQAVAFGGQRVAIDDQGNATAIWNEFDASSGHYVIRASSRLSGKGWSAPQTISDSSDNSTDTALAVDSAGNATAVWAMPGSVVQAATRSLGGSWSAPVDLSATGSPSAPQLAVDSAGDATAVWEATGGPKVMAASRPAGGSWSAEAELGIGQSPQIAVDSQNNATAVWVGSDAGGAAVQTSDSADGDLWSSPVDLATSSASDSVGFPWVAVDPQDTVTAIWARIADSDSTVTAQAVRRPPGGDWSAPIDLAVGPFPANLPAVGVGPQGYATVAWAPRTSPAGSSSVLDDVPPELRNPAVPARGTVGQPVDMSVDPFDDWSSVTTTWDFGDGGSASGAAVDHTYNSPGERTVTITGVDAAGNTTQTARKVTIDPAPEPRPSVAPVLSSLKRVGRTFRFQLDRAADVRLEFSRIVPGRRVRTRCAKPTKANRNKPRCQRFQARGAVTIAGSAGDNAYAFRGKVHGRTLEPGRYRLLVTASADGKTSTAASIGFTIVR